MRTKDGSQDVLAVAEAEGAGALFLAALRQQVRSRTWAQGVERGRVV